MRTPTKDIVKKISKILRDERPDYIYLRDLFKKIREEFDIVVTTQTKRLPYVSYRRGVEAVLQYCMANQKYEAHGSDKNTTLYRDSSSRVG